MSIICNWWRMSASQTKLYRALGLVAGYTGGGTLASLAQVSHRAAQVALLERTRRLLGVALLRGTSGAYRASRVMDITRAAAGSIVLGVVSPVVFRDEAVTVRRDSVTIRSNSAGHGRVCVYRLAGDLIECQDTTNSSRGQIRFHRQCSLVDYTGRLVRCILEVVSESDGWTVITAGESIICRPRLDLDELAALETARVLALLNGGLA